jgi:hypothetical protein
MRAQHQIQVPAPDSDSPSIRDAELVSEPLIELMRDGVAGGRWGRWRVGTSETPAGTGAEERRGGFCSGEKKINRYVV